MAGRLAGKRALVYGGGTGIGLACAQAIRREGAGVFLSGRREEALILAAATLAGAGYSAGDATSVEDVQRVTAAADAHLGGIDTIVVSAGAAGRTSIFETDVEEFQRIVDNNMRSLFLVVRFAASRLLASGSGSVIVLSSMYGLVGQRERVGYCGAKAGMIGMVRSMALDFAEHGVRVNAICPGYIETPLAIEVARMEPDPEAELARKRLMHPVPRAGRLDEAAELAVYLASDLSAFTTGQAIAIDGGYTVR